MQKAAPQQAPSQQQPAAKQPGAAPAHSTPGGEKIAQLEAMADSSPHAQKLAGLAAMMNASPAMAAQRKMADMIHNSPRQMKQQASFEAIHNSPRQTAQRGQFDSLFGTPQRAQEEDLPAQPKLAADSSTQLVQQPDLKPNNTGLPDNLKNGIESLSGISMDNVRVHYNSSQPAQLNALAYAQGTDIHVAHGQEQHLPHEAWHVVQQAQGRVQPTMQLKGGMPVNDDPGLEQEADAMGARALQMTSYDNTSAIQELKIHNPRSASESVQRSVGFEFETGWLLKAPANAIGMHTAVIEGTNWNVVPDRVDYTEEELSEMGIGQGETHVGSGSMEFVTDAFAENDIGPGGGLDKALLEIERTGRALIDAPKAGGWFSSNLDTNLSNAVTGGVRWGAHLALPALGRPGQSAFEAQLNKRENLLVRRIGNLAAAPQMTGGIKLDKLIHLLDKMSRGPGAPRAGQAVPSGALMAQSEPVEAQIQAECVRRARIIGGRRVNDNSIQLAQRETYEGILAILGSYIRLAKAYGSNIAYDKGIAPLLSRTDFGSFPNWARETLWFEEDVLLASGRYSGENEFDVYGQGTDKLFVKPGLHNELTTSGWIRGIIDGRDRLTWEQDRTNANWNPQMVGLHGNQAMGHVYEFRRLVNPLPFDEWRQYALDMANLVSLANQGNLS